MASESEGRPALNHPVPVKHDLTEQERLGASYRSTLNIWIQRHKDAAKIIQRYEDVIASVTDDLRSAMGDMADREDVSDDALWAATAQAYVRLQMLLNPSGEAEHEGHDHP